MRFDDVPMIVLRAFFLHFGDLSLPHLGDGGVQQHDGTDGNAHGIEIAVDAEHQHRVVGEHDQGNEQANRDQDYKPIRQETNRPGQDMIVQKRIDAIEQMLHFSSEAALQISPNTNSPALHSRLGLP